MTCLLSPLSPSHQSSSVSLLGDAVLLWQTGNMKCFCSLPSHPEVLSISYQQGNKIRKIRKVRENEDITHSCGTCTWQRNIHTEMQYEVATNCPKWKSWKSELNFRFFFSFFLFLFYFLFFFLINSQQFPLRFLNSSGSAVLLFLKHFPTSNFMRILASVFLLLFFKDFFVLIFVLLMEYKKTRKRDLASQSWLRHYEDFWILESTLFKLILSFGSVWKILVID